MHKTQKISPNLEIASFKDRLLAFLIDVPFIDSSGSISLEEVILDAQQKNDVVILCNMNDSVREVLQKVGVLKLIKSYYVLATRIEALQLAQQLLEQENAG